MSEKYSLVGSYSGLIPIHQGFIGGDILVSPTGEVVQLGTKTEQIFNTAGDRTSHTYTAADVGKIFRQLSDNTLWLLESEGPPPVFAELGAANQISNYIYNNETSRTSINNTYTTADLGKIARQLSDDSLWVLTSEGPPAVWTRIGDGADAASVNGKVPGAVNGLATLDTNSKVPLSQLPVTTLAETYVVNTEAAMLALSVQPGDVAIRTDLNKTFILQGSNPLILSNWTELVTPTSLGNAAALNVGTVVNTVAAGDHTHDGSEIVGQVSDSIHADSADNAVHANNADIATTTLKVRTTPPTTPANGDIWIVS